MGRGLHLLQDLGRFVYVGFVVDVFAQRIVGWHVATTKVTDVVLTPPRIALWDRDRQRDPGRAGSAAAPLRCLEPVHIHPVHQHLELEGIAPSIGTVGDAYPNALMESIIGPFKTEAIPTTVFHDGPYKASPTSSTSLPAGSTRTTTDACTGPSAGSPRSRTSRTITLPSAESRNPHRAAENRDASPCATAADITTRGLSQAEAARTYGLSQAWVSRLMAGYRVEGEAAFEPRSRRPKAASPRALPVEVRDLILRLRKKLGDAGLDAGTRHHRLAPRAPPRAWSPPARPSADTWLARD